MATIQQRKANDGSISYRAQIRIQGLPPQSKTFTRKTDARIWASQIETALRCLDDARFGIAWGALGAARACIDTVLRYTESRELFGRSLNSTQLIQSRLANAVRGLANAQVLAWRLARLKDEGRVESAQVSLAKWSNVRMALDVARDCRDMLGAAGITLDLSPMRHMLNLETVVTYEGTESIHELIVGRAITGQSAF